ncbi:MAG: hypothetical protein K6A79_03645 [Ruminococcus sp.]|nr:hypothetical protein [Ruminococcus sp.]
MNEKSALILDTFGIDKEKAWCSSYAPMIICELNAEQLEQVRKSELIDSVTLKDKNEPQETTCLPVSSGQETTVTTTEYHADEYYGNASFTDVIEKIDAAGVTFKENGYFHFSWQSITDRFASYKAGDEVILSCYYMRLYEGDTPNIQKVYMLSRSKLDLGDPTGDSKIDARDASFALAEYSLLSTGGASTLTTVEKTAADANKDGQIDSKDASLMLSMYAYNATSEKNIETMTEYIEYQRG